ncbi:hypothetical protein LZL87_005457 [Fusarium oxysporum]|nr:hypothetical protein LZL87_005457 [Fusarium oxysporum]
MAVLDEVPRITTRIRVAGELATEYDSLDDPETVVSLDKEGSKIPTKTCYIESKSGVEFAVETTVSDKYQFPHSHDSFNVHVYIDGQWMTARTDHTRDDRLKSDVKRAETLGTIHLRLETGRYQGKLRWEPPTWHSGRDVKLAEKALKGKAISHATSLTDTTVKPSAYALDVKNEFSQVKRKAEEYPRTPRQWKFVKLDDGKEAVDLTDD